MKKSEENFMLSGYRVVELEGTGGMFCGKIFADLGAEVIKVEKPGGDPARLTPPFYQDTRNPERSLFWFAYNSGKKSITLDIERSSGRELFKTIVKTSDFVIESSAPGRLEELGLGYTELRGINPRLIMASVTPFGQRGPYQEYKGSDLVCMALGGPLFLTGEPDREPVRIGFPQTDLLASFMAAVGSLIAHYHRESTGSGQYIDVSAQESVAWVTGNACISFEMEKLLIERGGSSRRLLFARAVQRLVWPCQDGAITFNIGGGKGFASSNRALVKAMDEEGFTDEYLKAVNWEGLDRATVTQEFMDKLEDRIGAFFKAHNKAQLYSLALERGIVLAPVSNVKELCENAQLGARGYWQSVEHPELGTTINNYPAPLFRMCTGGKPNVTRAPYVGEHNADIYQCELGFSSEQLETLAKNGVI